VRFAGHEGKFLRFRRSRRIFHRRLDWEYFRPQDLRFSDGVIALLAHQ